MVGTKLYRTYESSEPLQTFVLAVRVRRVLSETLGVNPEDLPDEVSLTDDLAADSLDLMQLVIALEEELAMDIDERKLASVRTVGDLIATMRAIAVDGGRSLQTAARASRPARRGRGGTPELSNEPRALPYRATLRGGAQEDTTLFRTGILTPYATDALLDDALRAGDGARLEISVPTATSDTEVTLVREHFDWLAARGIHVTVGRDYRSPGWGGVGVTGLPMA